MNYKPGKIYRWWKEVNHFLHINRAHWFLEPKLPKGTLCHRAQSLARGKAPQPPPSTWPSTASKAFFLKKYSLLSCKALAGLWGASWSREGWKGWPVNPLPLASVSVFNTHYSHSIRSWDHEELPQLRTDSRETLLIKLHMVEVHYIGKGLWKPSAPVEEGWITCRLHTQGPTIQENFEQNEIKVSLHSCVIPNARLGPTIPEVWRITGYKGRLGAGSYPQWWGGVWVSHDWSVPLLGSYIGGRRIPPLCRRCHILLPLLWRLCTCELRKLIVNWNLGGGTRKREGRPTCRFKAEPGSPGKRERVGHLRSPHRNKEVIPHRG